MKSIILSIAALLFLSTVTVVIIQFTKNTRPPQTSEILLDKNTGSSNVTSTSADREFYDEWTWQFSVDASGKVITPSDPARFRLTFEKEGRLRSTTDCNSLSGSFIKDGEVLTVGPLMSTLMACEGETLESVYVSELGLVSSYSIQEDTLTLFLIKDAGMMTFIRK